MFGPPRFGDKLSIPVDGGEQAWELLKWQPKLRVELEPEATGTGVRQCKLAKVFCRNADLLGHEAVLPWCGWGVQENWWGGGGSPT